MEKHNKKRASLRQYPVLLAFGLFFLGLFVLDLSHRTAPTASWKTPPSPSGPSSPLPRQTG